MSFNLYDNDVNAQPINYNFEECTIVVNAM